MTTETLTTLYMNSTERTSVGSVLWLNMLGDLGVTVIHTVGVTGVAAAVVVTVAEAAVAGTSMAPQFEQSTGSLLRICRAAAVGKI